MMCEEGSSPGFLSNFGISKGILDGISNHDGSWEIGSFFNRDKSDKSNVARKGNNANEYWEGVEVSTVSDGPCGPPMLVLLDTWGYPKEWFPTGMVEPTKA
jgi:hypothetical protein